MLDSVNYESAWSRLLTSLSTWADAREVAGGIQVCFLDRDGSQRTIEIVMTPDDWEEIADNIGKEDEDSIKGRILDLDKDEVFLVGASGVELIASPTREVPPDDFMPEPGGQWVATDESGHVVSRFADWND